MTDEMIKSMRALVAVAIKNLEALDEEFGSGSCFADLLAAGDAEAVIIQGAIDALAKAEGGA